MTLTRVSLLALVDGGLLFLGHFPTLVLAFELVLLLFHEAA